MSYYDPEVYNFEALNDENKDKVISFDLAVKALKCFKENVDEEYEDLPEKLRELFVEFAENVIDRALNSLVYVRLELIVSLVDGQTE